MNKVFRLFFALLFCLALSVTQANASDTIKIGVQAPTTGQYANEGQGIDQGVRLIAEQVNAKGGILGRQIEIFTCDDEGTAMKAAICAKDLVNKDVIAVIGSYTSTCAEAAQATYYREGVLQTTDGTSDTLTSHGYWTFYRNSFPNSAEATYTANYFVNVKKYKKIAIVSDFSSYSTGLGDSVVGEIKKLGGNIVYQGKIKAGEQNYTPVLTNIKSTQPDVIYFSGYYNEAGLLRAQQMQLGVKADFYGSNACDNPDYIKLAGKFVEGSYLINVPSPELLPYDLAINFLKDYKAKYKMDPPSIWTLLNIDGMRAILYAIEQTGTTDTKKLAEYLHTLKDYPGITGPIEWAPDGNRVGSAHQTYEYQADGSKKVIYPVVK
jgi:branched-chain amino acid transport system substrate-binding protein